MKNKKVLIGLSWVYANGRLHIGHVGSSLPADALARFHRRIGNDVSFVTGSDCYGTPILVESLKEGITPEELAEKYAASFKFTALNTSKARRVAIGQKVLGLPVLAMYKDGEKIRELVGDDATAESMETMLKEFM